ncbi:Sporulation and spore germination [Paenibacillus algorifonticola]|uniref:Sporulation and spore germination n=1 Tax=Paenibacillus algorifonticola TaxID=684063 RepID=A0A1I2C6K1_9BACL|nr:GerMN domain-containing protein [Paenibacillus algorifonticola]SFE63991.1 Sporulation and spore germination [Paenibacillus algorifonticola]
MLRTVSQFMLTLCIVGVVAGCAAVNKPAESGAGSSPSPSIQPSASPSAAPTAEPSIEPEKQTAEIKVYAANEELDNVVEQQVQVAYSSDLELVQNAITALQHAEGEGAASLWKLIEIKSVLLGSDGQVTIDVHLPDESRLGSPGEVLVLETLQKTLFQFDFVKSYDLLVDGDSADTLMGHVELEHPTRRP